MQPSRSSLHVPDRVPRPASPPLNVPTAPSRPCLHIPANRSRISLRPHPPSATLSAPAPAPAATALRTSRSRSVAAQRGPPRAALGSHDGARCRGLQQQCCAAAGLPLAWLTSWQMGRLGTAVGQHPPTPFHGYLPGCWGDGRCGDGAVRLHLPSLAGD
eukprot:scaffold3340_cov114-Isochrysis_galbana.AAC.8